MLIVLLTLLNHSIILAKLQATFGLVHDGTEWWRVVYCRWAHLILLQLVELLVIAGFWIFHHSSFFRPGSLRRYHGRLVVAPRAEFGLLVVVRCHVLSSDFFPAIFVVDVVVIAALFHAKHFDLRIVILAFDCSQTNIWVVDYPDRLLIHWLIRVKFWPEDFLGYLWLLRELLQIFELFLQFLLFLQLLKQFKLLQSQSFLFFLL